MNRVLSICLCVLVFAGCKKSDDALKVAQAQAQVDDALIQNYITTNKLNATKVQVGTQDTTGVWYIITTQGNQATYFTNSSLLTVSYTGKLLSTGTIFTQTNGFNPSYRLGDMIKGWQLGFIYSKILKGGTIRLLMASRYAYGPYAQQAIPANSVLDFNIELFDVTN